MSDGVKWIHITADVFDNWKVKHLKAMPEIGHALVCIWFELLCLAGKCNHPSGFIVMSEKFIISDEMIADMFNEDVKLVQMALQTFEKLGMIQITDSHAIQITNWFEYQNEAGLAQIRGYEREKKANYRAKAALKIEQKTSTDMSMDNSMDSSISISLSNNKENKYIYNNHSNTENLIYILDNNEKYKNINEQFKQALIDWCEYKDERKPKSKNHYSESALKKFISQAGNKASEVGIKRVVEQINIAIVNQWQGAGLERIENGK